MRRNISAQSLKRVSQRTCVACREIRDKREMVRLVRASDNSVEVDVSGKKPGRGAYLCRTRECWEIGLKGSRLEHSLKAPLTQDNREQLIRFSKGLVGGGG